MPTLRIGISGWRYPPWRGTFYPESLPQKSELAYASRQLNSIELNGSFYSLQRPSSWLSWYNETPSDFLFSIKASRYITHIKRLKDIDEPLANFFAQGLLALQEKLGPILWQFPPSFKFNPDLLDAFFQKLPHDTHAAAQLAAQHTDFMKGRTYLESPKNQPLRHAIEIRHDSFKSPEFIVLLRKHNIALVVADTAGKWPLLEDLTSNFIYARLHGDEQLYVSGYTPEALKHWATRIHAWQKGTEVSDAHHASPKLGQKLKSRDIFCYFDNDVKVRAPFDAQSLAKLVHGFIPSSGSTLPPKSSSDDPRMFCPAIKKPKKR